MRTRGSQWQWMTDGFDAFNWDGRQQSTVGEMSMMEIRGRLGAIAEILPGLEADGFNRVRAAIEGGVSLVVLSDEKRAPDALLSLAAELKALLDRYEIPLILRRAVTVAAEIDAAGVELGRMDVPVWTARAIVGEKKLIGYTAETVSQLDEALELPIDYLSLSPVFLTAQHRQLAPCWGLNGIRQVRTQTALPLIAVGGVTEHNASSVLAAGADSLAMRLNASDAPIKKQAAQLIREFPRRGLIRTQSEPRDSV